MLNAEGKQLEIGDLLKNYIFAQNQNEDERAFLERKWGEVVENVKEEKGRATDLVLMLRHFILQNGLLLRINLQRQKS